MLPKRLKSLYDLVDLGSCTLDIGCDHALLSISLSKDKIITNGIISDINENALNIGINNINKYKITNLIPILADGTNIPNIDSINTIIISGLGTNTIINIISRDISILPDTIIICSNNDYLYLRKYMISIGYKINKEILVKDNNKFYITIKFIKGKTKYSKKQLLLGFINQQELYQEYIKQLYTKLLDIYQKVPYKLIFKRLKIKKLLNIYKTEMTN